MRNGNPVKVDPSPIRSPADALDCHVTLVEAVASGTITAEGAEAISSLLTGTLRAIEMVDC